MGLIDLKTCDRFAPARRMLTSRFMPVSPQLISVGFSLAAVLFWGTSDFLGGYASRNANAVLVTAITNGSGLVAIIMVAVLSGEQIPGGPGVAWALAGGAFGGSALAVFYRALASGNMGLAAPISAILSAAIPALFGVFVQGLPRAPQLTGFILAAVGIG